MEEISIFTSKLLNLGIFISSEISSRYYQELLSEAVAGFSRLRNTFKFKAEVVLADGRYLVDKLEKQLTAYDGDSY